MDTIVELVILLVRLKIAIEPEPEPEPEPATEPEPEPATEPEPEPATEPATKVKVKREPLYYIRYIKQEPTKVVETNDGRTNYTFFGRFNISLFRRDRVNADGTWNVSRIQEYYLEAGKKRPLLTRQCPDAVAIIKNEEPPEFVNKVDFLNSTAKYAYIKISEKKITRKMFPEIIQAV